MAEENPLQFKNQAKLLRQALEKRGYKINHAIAIELLAESLGHRNYNTMQATMFKVLRGSSDGGFDVSHVLPDGRISGYLNTKFITATGQARAIFKVVPSNFGNWQRYNTEDPSPFNGVYFEHQSLAKPLLAISFDENIAEVVNIVPAVDGLPITLAEANQLETDFVNVVRGHLPKSLRIEQQPTHVHLRDRVRESTYRMFKYHSANKSTGNTHPLDEKRWLEFVLEAAREGIAGTDADAGLVFAALISEGFPERHAKRMSLDFQTQIEAMQFYRKNAA